MNDKLQVYKNFMQFLLKIAPTFVKQIGLKDLEIEIKTTSNNFLNLINILKNHTKTQFQIINDLIVYDVPGKHYRFSLVYHLLSVAFNSRVRVVLKTKESLPVTTIVPYFKGANWLEREAFDGYGVVFLGHPDLRRILTDYGFSGHPLRKDFPLTGFKEVLYCNKEKKVLYRPVSIAQEFRVFDFKNP